MAEDPPHSAGKPVPPPPDVATSPPPAPPAPPEPPGPASSEPPLKIGGGAASGASAAPVAKDAPGADASIGNRIVAGLLDFLIAFGINVVVSIVLNFLPVPGFIRQLGGFVGLAYLLVRDSLPFLDGQSVGKKALKIRAVTLDGQPLTGNWNPGLLRNVLLLIPFFGALVELIVLLTRQDKPAPLQRLGDEWAKTRVINVDPAAASDTASSPPPAPPEGGGQ